MHIKSLLLFLLTGCAVLGSVQAQDIHFTQFNYSPLTLNPAMQGNFSGTVRIGGIYRSQWQSVLGSGKYSTPALFVDAPIIRGFRRRDWVGIGAGFFSDQAGTFAIKRSSFSIGATYHLALNRRGDTYLSIGGQYGSESRKLNPGGPGFFDNLDNGQTLQQSQDYALISQALDGGKSYNNYNAGIALNSRLNERMDMTIGFAMFRIVEPDYSVLQGGMGTGVREFPRRSVVHGQFNVEMTDRWTVSPAFLYQTMAGTNDEIQVQGRAHYLFDVERDIELNFGVGYRLRDALPVLAGVRYKDLRVGLAYDLNTSSLSSETNYRGGFEIAANYIIRIYKQSKVEPKILCPRF